MEFLAVATWRIPKAPLEDVERASALGGWESALHAFLHARYGIEETVYVATCQRVILTYVAPEDSPSPAEVLEAAVSHLLPAAGAAKTAPEAFTGFAAFEHLAEVSASLDSLVPGEAQILGQVKGAFQAADAQGHVGKILRRTYGLVFKAAKRIRSDTALFRGKVSLIPLTVELIEARMAGVPRPEVAVVGTGTIGRRMLDLLRDYPTPALHLVSRAKERAAETAAPYGARAHELAAFLEKPPSVDILVLSARADEPLLTAEAARRFAAARATPERPLLVIDLALPRNASEDVRDVDGIALVQIDELANISERNRQERARELETARDLLKEELHALRHAFQADKEKPLILDVKTAMDEAADERLRMARDLLAPTGVNVDDPAFQRWYQQAVKHFTHVALTHTRKRLREDAVEEREAA